MAIYYLKCKVSSRSKGHNAIAAAAYRRGIAIKDLKKNTKYNYSNKEEIVFSGFAIPENAPEWLVKYKEGFDKEDRKVIEWYWNYYESCEKRKDAQLTRDLIVALPKELTTEQQIKLLQEYVQDQLAKRGMVVDYSLHHDKGNPHAHIAMSMRSVEATGFGEKVRAWNDKSFVQAILQSWTEYANFHLKLAGHDVRIDHRSNKDQGIDLLPSFHVGRAAYDLERRGVPSALVAKAESIREENLRRISNNPTLIYDKLMTQRETFTAEHVLEEVSRYTRVANPDYDETSRAKVLSDVKIKKILEGIEYHESVFTNQDLAKALFEHVNKDDAQVFMNALVELKASRELVYLGAGDSGQDCYTTRKMFKLESGIQNQVELLKASKHFTIEPQLITDAINEYAAMKGKSLLDDQHDAVVYALSNRQIACVVGRAGTGKSFSLGAANFVWEKAGFEVLGVALSGVAADGLAKDAKMKSSTIESFKHQLKQGKLELKKRTVVVMDEAGMTDSISMGFVIDAVVKAGAKLVLVGDPAQLQPVGPGAVFRCIIETMPGDFRELVNVFRQSLPWQKVATIDFSKGKASDALTAYENEGCVHYLSKKDEAMGALATRWKETYISGTPLKEIIVLAYTREDVKALNQTVRSIRLEAGDLKNSETIQTTRGEIQLAEGDRILFLKNNSTLGVKNGRFAVVDGIEKKDGWAYVFATLDGDEGQKVVIDTHQYQDFDYGYAATVHKTQGATVDRSLLYISRGWDRCLAYVGMTRHRHRCDVFTDLSPEGLIQEVQKFALKDSLLDFPYHFALRRGFDQDSLTDRLGVHLHDKLAHLKAEITGRYNDLNEQHWEGVAKRIENDSEFKSIFARRDRARLVAYYADTSREAGQMYRKITEKMAELNLPKMDHKDPRIIALKESEEYKNFTTYLRHRDELAHEIIKDEADLKLAIEKSNIDRNKLKTGALRHEMRGDVKIYVEEALKNRPIIRDKLAMLLALDIKGYYPLLLEAGVDTSSFYNQARTHERRLFNKGLTTLERQRLREVERYLALEQETIRLYVKNNPKDALQKSYTFTKDPHYQHVAKERDSIAFHILNHIQDYGKQLDFYEIGIARSQFGSLEKPGETAIQKANQRWAKLEREGRSHQIRLALHGYIDARKNQNDVLAMQLAAELVRDKKAGFREFAEEFGPKDTMWFDIHKDARAFNNLNFYKGLTSDEDRELFKAVEPFNDIVLETRRAWAKALDGAPSPVNYRLLKGPLVDAAKAMGDIKFEAARNLLKHYVPGHAVYAYFKLDYDTLKTDAGFKDVNDESLQLVVKYQALCQNKDHKKADYITQAELAQKILENKDTLRRTITGLDVSWDSLFHDTKNAYRHYLLNTLVPEHKLEARMLLKYDTVNREVGRTYGETCEYKDRNQKPPASLEAKINKLSAERDRLASQIVAVASDKLIAKVLSEDKVAKIVDQAQKHDLRLTQVEDYAQKQKHYLQSLQNCVKQNSYSVDFIYVQDELKELMHPLEKNLDLYQFALKAKGLSKEQLLEDKAIFKTYEELAYRTAGFSTAPTPSAITADDQAKIKRVQNILKGTTPIEGTLAERYLREYRGIGEVLPPSCRFHPGMKHFETGQKYPALVVTAQNIDKSIGKPTAQVIYLDLATGNKAPLEAAKLTYGRFVEGTAVLINEGKDPTCVVITEGPETGLSVREADLDLTIYAVFGSGNFKKIPLSEHVKKIIFCADNDYKIDPAEQKGIPASEKKVMEAAEYFAEKGIDVYRVMPKNAKEDFNDVLKKEGVEKVREYLAQPEKIAEGVRVDRLEAKVEEYLNKAMPDVPSKKTVSKEGDVIVLPQVLSDLIKAYLQAEDVHNAAVDKYYKNFSKPDKKEAFKQEMMDTELPVKALLKDLLEEPAYQDLIKHQKFSLTKNEETKAQIEKIKSDLENNRLNPEQIYKLSTNIESNAKSLKVIQSQSKGMSQSL